MNMVIRWTILVFSLFQVVVLLINMHKKDELRILLGLFIYALGLSAFYAVNLVYQYGLWDAITPQFLNGFSGYVHLLGATATAASSFAIYNADKYLEVQHGKS